MSAVEFCSFLVETTVGPARVELDVPLDAETLLVLGHGAGGSVDAPDLLAVRDRCLVAGLAVARVTQPYRVAGKKAPPTAATLDAAWLAVASDLGRRPDTRALPQVFAGRSSGARVACRTAAQRPGVIGVVALAFPVHPPGKPEKSRIEELDAAGVPVLVVQGLSDPFGMPGRRRGRKIVTVAGDHSLKQSADEVGREVATWVAKLAESNR